MLGDILKIFLNIHMSENKTCLNDLYWSVRIVFTLTNE